jgi:hypothetical protein
MARPTKWMEMIILSIPIFKIIPRDKDWNFLDISGFLLEGKEVKLSETQLVEKRNQQLNS